jgi:protocatechuate 3,4-dioxygenase beta subunit
VIVVLAAVTLVLSGRVLDQTTGQPLAGVHLQAGRASATTDAHGRYALRGLHAGPVTLVLESDDVPPQQLSVTLGPASTRHDLRACSTTLDYNCSAVQPPSGN